VSLAALEGFEPEIARRVVRVADAVLDSSLRAWSAGRLPIGEVYRSLSEVVAGCCRLTDRADRGTHAMH